MAQRHDWYITLVSTGQRYRIEPGDSVVIGRTPLRPGSLPPEKAKRLSIPDPERSMSKRHMLLSLDRQGVASVEDLHSTNGTYVVRSDNRLIRLPSGRLFQLDESPVRLQLGDIGLVLTRHNLPQPAVATEPSQTESAQSPQKRQTQDQGASQHSHPETGLSPSHNPSGSPQKAFSQPLASSSHTDLFSHSVQNGDSSDLGSGVDDIVAAREGEPTNVFDAERVKDSLAASASAPSSGQGEQSPKAGTSLAGTAQRPAQTSPAPAGSTGFEPGSVFDRLTRGEMGKPSAPEVEVDGFTSEEARRSADHDKQFQMARHRQLLPFLAENPYLYQELYQWLASIPDPVIASALDHNPGYHAANGKDAK